MIETDMASILELLLGIRQLALAGATPAQLRPTRRPLIFASAVTLALNVADPLVTDEYGKAAFDAVGPLLLIGWAEVGPDLMRALTIARQPAEAPLDDAKPDQCPLTRLSAADLEATFDELFAINVKGYFLSAEAAWRELVKTRGSIVMTLSNASFYVNGGGPVYTASKHACLGLMRELAYELAPKVRVNGVACGGMNTDLRGPAALSMKDRSLAASFAKKRPDTPPPPIPLHDSSTDPRDFTGAYVLLASREQSSPITGQAIPVDGGIGVRGFATAAGGDHL